MSLINQVLIDLEQRGASTSIGEATVRVVPVRQGYGKLWLLIAALAVAVLAATVWLKLDGEIRVRASSAAPTTVASSVVPPPELQHVAAAEVDPATAAPSSPLADNTADTSRAASPVKEATLSKPLAIVAPVITAISPNPVISLGVKQAVSIGGKNFAPDAVVILRTPKGKEFSKRKIVLQDSNQIVLSTNFREIAGTWSVVIENASGQSSAPYIFTVQSAPEVAQLDVRDKHASPAKTAKSSAKLATVEMPPVEKAIAGISKQPTQVTPQQQAENEFRKAYALMQKGQGSGAISGYETALSLDAGHVAARHNLVRLLLENKRNAEAERLLQEGLQHDPKQSSLAMLLARMQVGRNELSQALDTMQKSLPYAQQQADYQAFVAALLQRQNRHTEAIDYYQKAVQLSPQSGVWLMGLGISLRAEQRNAEAKDAFKRALQANSLSAELNAYVNQQLKEL